MGNAAHYHHYRHYATITGGGPVKDPRPSWDYCSIQDRMTFFERCTDAGLSMPQSKKALLAFFDKFGIRATTKDRDVLKEKAAALTWAYHHKDYSVEWPTTLEKDELKYLQRVLPHSRTAQSGEGPTETLLLRDVFLI